MNMTDPIADMLTRIRNAQMREKALAWIAANPKAVQPWDDKAYKMPGGTPSNPKIAGALVVDPSEVFRIGLLMFGRPPNLGTLIRWVRAA